MYPSGAVLIEPATIDGQRQLFEMPAPESGPFVSGGARANFTCLAVARHLKLAGDPNNASIYFSG
jgi:glutamate/tyrosine decarboxylase-like PLP-dependent enzyme